MIEEGVGRPILIGRPEVIEPALRTHRRCRSGSGPRLRTRQSRERPALPGVLGDLSPASCSAGASPPTSPAPSCAPTPPPSRAVMVHRGEADSLICGTFGQYLWHLNYVSQVLGTPRAPADRRAVADDPRERRALHRRHPGPPRAQPGADRRGRRSPRRATCAASGWSPRSRSARTRSSATSTPTPGGGCARRWHILDAAGRATSTTRARCIPTRRSTRSCGRGIFPNCALRGRRPTS